LSIFSYSFFGLRYLYLLVGSDVLRSLFPHFVQKWVLHFNSLKKNGNREEKKPNINNNLKKKRANISVCNLGIAYSIFSQYGQYIRTITGGIALLCFSFL